MVKRTGLFISISFFIIICIFGCSLKKNVVDTRNKAITEKELYKRLNFIDINSKYIVIKSSKISIDDNNMLTNLKANFVLVKDSAILISVSNILGIEITRAVLLPDSIKVVDRVNKTYLEDRFSEIERKFSIALDFYQIQSILTGDFIYLTNNREKEIQDGEKISEKGTYKLVLSSNNNFSRTESMLFIDQNLFTVTKANILIEYKKQEYEINYDDYVNLNNYLYPGFIEIEYTKNNESIKLAIQNKNIRIESSKKVILDVPTNYERKKTGIYKN